MLRPYQRDLVARLIAHRQYALFVEMGLGKTAVVLDALGALDAYGDLPRPVVVVGPPNVIRHTWPHETALWLPEWEVSEMCNPEDWAWLMGASNRIGTVSSAKLRATDQERPAYARGGTLVIDELSQYKAAPVLRRGDGAMVAKSASQRATVVYEWAREAERVWGLTGMIAPNSLEDTWGEMAVIDGGQSLGMSKQEFRNAFMYVDPASYHMDFQRWLPRAEAPEAVARLIAPRSVTLRAADVDLQLPDLVVQTVPVEMPLDARKQYREMAREAALTLEGETDPSVLALSLGGVAMKLRQITAGWVKNTQTGEWFHLHDAKLDALRELRDEINSPLLVEVQFIPEAQAIRDAFGAVELSVDNMDAWNRGEIEMAVTHPASTGHGLNLQHGGHHIVWASLPWNLDHWAQANARLARQGQRAGAVIAHVLEVPHTYDARVAQALRDKADLQDNLLTYLRKEINV